MTFSYNIYYYNTPDVTDEKKIAAKICRKSIRTSEVFSNDFPFKMTNDIHNIAD